MLKDLSYSLFVRKESQYQWMNAQSIRHVRIPSIRKRVVYATVDISHQIIILHY
jgi:hypothetical protein